MRRWHRPLPPGESATAPSVRSRTAPNRFFREVPKDGCVLIGFRCGLGKFGNIGTVYALQAIYRGPNGIERAGTRAVR